MTTVPKKNKSFRTVAVIGAGPIGLDAALAARALGLDFVVLEAGEKAGAAVAEWGHVRLFSGWELNVSSRMAVALAEAGRSVPEGGAPTGAELVERLLEPVAALEGIREHVRTGTRVRTVGRRGLLKHEEIGTGKRGDQPFRLLVEDAAGGEWIQEAQIVLDCSGTWGNPNWLGVGGIPALGERSCRSIVRRIPDVSGDPDSWRGRRVLLVGGGHSAFTTAVELARLAEEGGGTELVWAFRRASPEFTTYVDDPLPGRSELVAGARGLVETSPPYLRVITGASVVSVAEAGNGVRVELADPGGGTREVTADVVVSLTGSTGDRTLYQHLQVHECYATQGPMKLAAALLSAAGGADCLEQTSHGADSLANPEPDFFILGAKSYGRNNTFLLRVGFDQVTDVFAKLGLPSSAAVA